MFLPPPQPPPPPPPPIGVHRNIEKITMNLTFLPADEDGSRKRTDVTVDQQRFSEEEYVCSVIIIPLLSRK